MIRDQGITVKQSADSSLAKHRRLSVNEVFFAPFDPINRYVLGLADLEQS